MIHWEQGEPPASKMLTLNSFAVRKDETTDRLISWYWVQNEHMLPPDEVDLPDPGVFDRVSHDSSRRLTGFAIDIANMFHNVVLPAWLIRYFSLRPIAFGNLSGDAQRALCAQLGLSARPKQCERFTPYQRTLPMGFEWAVS